MPSSGPSATVLIGAHDNESTVERAIRSILDQTVADLELLVIDDGSRDRSVAVAEQAIGDDPRGRVLPLGENLGIARSLNRGLRQARSPLVAIQDADDYSEPDRLERQLAVLESDKTIALVGGRMREVDTADRQLRPRTTFRAGDVRDVLVRFNPIPNGSAAFRRDVALAVGGYDPEFKYAAEYDLWLRIADRHRVVTLDEVLATRVMWPANVAARAERAQLAEAIAIRVRTMRRRRSPRGATALIRPTSSYLTPIPIKRALRRARGQAP